MNKTIEILFKEMWNQQKFELANELFSPQFQVYYSGGGVNTHQEFREMLENWFIGIPDLHHTVDDYFEHGHKIAVRWTGKGTHHGEFSGIAATGKPFCYEGITIFYLDENQKINEAWVSTNLPDAIVSLQN